MDKTVWKDREKKWTPRNKQAALVFTKAKPFHLPLPPEARIVETRQQRIDRENRERSERVKEIKADQSRREAEAKRKQDENERENWKKRMKRFHKKQTAKMDRLAAKIAWKLSK